MPVPNPPIISVPFADAAGGTYIQNPIPVAPAATGRASYTEGFPPITFQPETAGGVPPDGRDFNGILFAVTSYCAYVQGGQLFPYNAAFATAISGYKAGSILRSTDGATIWFNLSDGNATDPDGGGAANWVPLYTYGTYSIVTTGGTTTLTAAQSRYGVLLVSGALVSNAVIEIPPAIRNGWLIVNATTGAFTLTVKTPAGTGIAVAQGGPASPTGIWCNGANIYGTQTPLAYAIDAAATPNTLALRDNLGQLLATRLNQSSTVENPTIGAVFVENAGADGFLRKISLPDFSAQLAPTVLDNGLGGTNQTWQNVLAFRNINTAYTNTTGRPISVSFGISLGIGAAATLYVGVSPVAWCSNGGANTGHTLSAIVPDGEAYEVLVTGTYFGLNNWAELR